MQQFKMVAKFFRNTKYFKAKHNNFDGNQTVDSGA
jgi:hypothetical protein